MSAGLPAEGLTLPSFEDIVRRIVREELDAASSMHTTEDALRLLARRNAMRVPSGAAAVRSLVDQQKRDRQARANQKEHDARVRLEADRVHRPLRGLAKHLAKGLAVLERVFHLKDLATVVHLNTHAFPSLIPPRSVGDGSTRGPNLQPGAGHAESGDA